TTPISRVAIATSVFGVIDGPSAARRGPTSTVAVSGWPGTFAISPRRNAVVATDDIHSPGVSGDTRATTRNGQPLRQWLYQGTPPIVLPGIIAAGSHTSTGSRSIPANPSGITPMIV